MTFDWSQVGPRAREPRKRAPVRRDPARRPGRLQGKVYLTQNDLEALMTAIRVLEANGLIEADEVHRFQSLHARFETARERFDHDDPNEPMF